MKTSDTVPFRLGGKKKKETNISNGCHIYLPALRSEDAGSSTSFPNVGVHLFNVTMTSPQYEQKVF
jgi:hypothetical protein